MRVAEDWHEATCAIFASFPFTRFYEGKPWMSNERWVLALMVMSLESLWEE